MKDMSDKVNKSEERRMEFVAFGTGKLQIIRLQGWLQVNYYDHRDDVSPLRMETVRYHQLEPLIRALQGGRDAVRHDHEIGMRLGHESDPDFSEHYRAEIERDRIVNGE